MIFRILKQNLAIKNKLKIVTKSGQNHQKGIFISFEVQGCIQKALDKEVT